MNITVARENYEEILAMLNEKGVVIIPNYLQEPVLSQMAEEFETVLNMPDNAYRKQLKMEVGRAASLDRFKLSTDDLPSVASVFSDKFMAQLTNDYYTPKPHVLNDTIFVANDVVGTKHLAQDLHFDVVPTLKYFIYLTDTTTENGAFTCVPGSHTITAGIRKKHGSRISYKNRHLTRDLPVNPADAMPIEGKAGTLIIFTTETLHKAGIVSKGERRIMRGHSRIKENKSIFSRLVKKAKQLVS